MPRAYTEVSQIKMLPSYFINQINESLKGVMLSTSPEDLVCYGYDASGLESCPSAVIWPKNTNEVVRIIQFAYEHGIPVTPRGAGTGTTGGSIPLMSSIVLSLEKMNKIIEVDEKNLIAIVEPGVINGKLQWELEHKGFFFPPDPASLNYCTIGGNVAENAGGPRALKYGVTRDYVLQLEAVLADGSVITAGVKTRKGVVGYDIARLLIGSEGTLAVITKIWLKILPLPEKIITLLATFNDLAATGDAVSKIIASKIIPTTIELMDKEAISAVESYKSAGMPKNIEALLLIELDGDFSDISNQAKKIVDICLSLKGEVKIAEDALSREKLWEARRLVSPALYKISPAKISQDIVVPRDKITEILEGLRKLSKEHNIKIVNFGHAGDGNIHVNIMTDKNDPEHYQKARGIVKNIFEMTLGFGGTISGEHGVGITKAPYIKMEIKECELNLMKGIKNLFDPKNILNPGKMFE